MKRGMKTRLGAVLTAGAMMLAVASPAMAQIERPVQVITGNNLVSVLNNPNVNITEVRVVNVEDSVNNNRVLNNVDVDALQNFLNNNNVDVNVEDVLQNFLNNNNVDVDVEDVIIQGVSVQGTTLLIFV
jgi:hypothetical protein